MYVHSTVVMNWQTRRSPRALTVVSARKLEKLALNSGTTGGARKMTQKCAKKALHPTQLQPVSVQTGCPRNQAMNRICGTSHCETASLLDHRDVHTFSMNCTSKDIDHLESTATAEPPLFSALAETSPAPVARTTGVSKPCPELTVWTRTPDVHNNGHVNILSARKNNVQISKDSERATDASPVRARN